MDRPERVSLVMPPSTTMLKTQAAQPPSHSDIALLAPLLRPAPRALLDVLACKHSSTIYHDMLIPALGWHACKQV